MNGKEKGCEAIKEFKRRGGRDAEPYLLCDHNERSGISEWCGHYYGLRVKGIWEGFKAMTCQ